MENLISIRHMDSSACSLAAALLAEPPLADSSACRLVAALLAEPFDSSACSRLVAVLLAEPFAQPSSTDKRKSVVAAPEDCTY